MLRSLASVTDLEQRAAALEERLRGDARAIVEDLEQCVRAAAHGSGADRDVLVSLAFLRAKRDDHALVARLAAVATEKHLHLAVPLLCTTEALRRLARHARLADPSASAWSYGALSTRMARAWVDDRAVLLPVARGALRAMHAPLRERALRDPRAQVVARLINGGSLELRDVLRIAARRPSTPEIARAIASSPAWVQQAPVREALVRNPFTPTWLSLVLLPTVRRGVLDRAPVHPELRVYARALGAAASADG